MISLTSLGGATAVARYFTAMAVANYQTSPGEPLGEWVGRTAQEFDLWEPVTQEGLVRALEGFHPLTGEALTQISGPDHHCGWDACLSAPADVSKGLWAMGCPETRGLLAQAHRSAALKTISFLEDRCAWSRRGKGGERLERATPLMCMFEQGSNRLGEPHLHTHIEICDVSYRVSDGSTGAVHARPIFADKMLLGSVYRAHLAQELQQLGFETYCDGWKLRVRGVPDSLVKALSTRRAEVEAELDRRGLSSARAAEFATLSTRGEKIMHSREELHSRWQPVGLEHGLGEKEVELLRGRQLIHRRDDPTELERLATRAVRDLTEQNSTFTEGQLLRRVLESAPDCPMTVHGAQEMLEAYAKRELIGVSRDTFEKRFTSHEVLQLETQLLSDASALRDTPPPAIHRMALPAAIEMVERRRGIELSADQVQAVHTIAGEAGSLGLLRGIAGSGKTSILECLRLAYELSGREVLGATVSAKAARVLEKEAGIESQPIARLLLKMEAPWGPRQVLKERDVLIIDEASMVGTRQAQRLLAHAREAKATVILVGDDRQLQSIELGSPFSGLLKRQSHAELTEIIRQKEEWSRQMVRDAGAGEGESVVRMLAQRGHLTVEETRDGARAALIGDWAKAHGRSPERTVILTETRAEARELNRACQDQRYDLGEIPSWPAVEGLEGVLHDRDRVLVLKNDRASGISNGETGTVLGIDVVGKALTLRLDEGREVTLPLSKAKELLAPGYAMTTHKAQGVTVEGTVYVLFGEMQHREMAYVQLSRGKLDVQGYVDQVTAGEDLTELSRRLSKSKAKELAHDMRDQYAREQEEAHRRSP